MATTVVMTPGSFKMATTGPHHDASSTVTGGLGDATLDFMTEVLRATPQDGAELWFQVVVSNSTSNIQCYRVS